EFLLGFLAGGPRTSSEVWSAAQEQLLSARTLGRARKELRIHTRRRGQQPQQVTYWFLESQELPRDEREEGDRPSIVDMLAELERQFPRSNPLDEADEA